MDAFFLLLLVVVSFVLAFYGAAVGLILGHLRQPLLLCYVPAAAGAANGLMISGVGAFSGALRHLREGRVSVRVLLLMGVPSLVGGVIGACLLVTVDPGWAKVFVGSFLVLSAVSLLRARPAEDAPDKVELSVALRLVIEVAIGLLLGVLAAVTGLMMGSMRLPMMIKYLKIDPRVAVGTNMAVGCLTAFGSAAAFLWQSPDMPLWPVLLLTPPTVLGGWLGARWTGHFKKETLAVLVGWSVALAGVLMVGEGALKASGTVAAPPVAQQVQKPARRSISLAWFRVRR